jgi:lysophospholipase L1-like esterase
LLGANDAVVPLPTTTQHVPIDRYKENLIKIITHPIIRGHNPKILLVTPPPLDEIRTTELDLAWGHAESTRQSKISAEYSQKARDVAAEVPGVVLIDLWQAVMDKAISMTDSFAVGGPLLGSPECGQQGGLKDLLPDGLHMSGDAYRVFYDIVAPHIGAEWDLLPEGDCSGYLHPTWMQLRPQPPKP